MTVPEVIQKALDFEEHGAQYYQEKAKEAANPLVKRLFLALAVEENQHQLRIQEIYQALKNDGPWPESNAGTVLQDVIKRYFSNLSEDERKIADNTDALSVAMDLEKKGYAMYQDAAAKAATPLEKEFFRSMQAEEGGHYEALENVYYYLTDTEDWFSSEESKVWNWMSW